MSWCAPSNPADDGRPPLPAANDVEMRYEFSLAPVVEFDTDPENTAQSASSAHALTANSADAAVGTGSGRDGATLSASVASTTRIARGALRQASRGVAKGRGGGVARPPTRGALSHTKLCRDRLNGMFDLLRSTLPAAPVGVEVKHKAQVLDYAISVLKSMVRQTSELEIELAVSSNRATMDWVSKLVASAASFVDVATEVMRVFSKRRHWRLAELWQTHRVDRNNVHLRFGAAVVNDSMGARAPTGEGVAGFAESSRSFVFLLNEGVQGRVWMSMRPEWLAGLKDTNDFVRAPLAQRYGIKTCLAVPITITGKIEAVMCFYDTKHRPYNSQCVDLAMRLTWALGNATGGKRAGAMENSEATVRNK